VGVYLTGSFALGGGDAASDCDFLVVADGGLTGDEERALRQLHEEIPSREGYWATNLEGSYAPREDLETLAALGRPWLFVNRGHREMEWSPHCNTEVGHFDSGRACADHPVRLRRSQEPGDRLLGATGRGGVKANGLPLRRARFGPAPGIVELRHAGLEVDVDVDVKRKGTQSVTWYSGSTDAERSTATRNVIVTWPPRDTRSVETALRRLRSHV
jgi:hypothetical protein